MRISWQTRSKLLYECISQQKPLPGMNGGNAYDFQAAMALNSKHQVFADKHAVWKKDNPITYWWRMRKESPADVAIMEPYPVVFGTFGKPVFRIAMIHHIDFDRIRNSRKHRWFFTRMVKRMKRFDRVVTVSQFWKDHLEEEGCRNVSVVYNSFDPSNYEFTPPERLDFRRKLGFNTDQPLIYIGNSSAEKGVYEVYNALKDEPFQMVMTGGSNKAADLPVKFFSLSPPEYRQLISACDVVLAFSSMMEGWNRVAHEAMLCKVPVIGSGTGGMMELLEGGKQLVARNKSELPQLINEAMNNKQPLGENGYTYARQFDLAYFHEAWLELLPG